MRATVLLLIAILSLALSGCTRRGADWDLDQARCHFGWSIGYWFGGLECYRLRVPEDHENPDGRTIELGVYLVKAHRRTGLPPIVYLMGGPGESAHYALIALRDHPLRDVRDVIVLEQRGAGVSRSFCEEFQSFFYRSVASIEDDEESDRMYDFGLLGCFTEADRRGINVLNYNTEQNALDLASLRVALDIDTMDIWAVSYGTVLTQAVHDLEPNNIGDVVLDGMLPIDQPWLGRLTGQVAETLNSIWRYCVDYQDCPKADQWYLQRLYGIHDQYDREPLTVPMWSGTESENDVVISGDGAVSLVISTLYQSHGHLAIPQVLVELEARDVPSLTERLQWSSDPYFSNGMFYAMRCQAARASAPEFELLTDAYPEFRERYDFAGLNESCNVLGIEQAENARRVPDTFEQPLLIMTGEWDHISPNGLARNVIDRFPHSTIVDVPLGGHGTSLWLPCARQLVADYFESGSTELTISCELAYGED